MFGFNRDSWRGILGGYGLPGIINANNQIFGGLMGGMFPGGGDMGYDGSATNMSQLLAAMRNQGGGGVQSQQQGPYLGGDGLI